MKRHDLNLRSGGGGSCTCGETFEGTPVETYRQWETHTEVATLLVAVRKHALAERAERAAGEEAMRRLVELGMSGRAVSEAVGIDESGTLMVSPTLVQRLGRGEYVKSPRRRHRS